MHKIAEKTAQKLKKQLKNPIISLEYHKKIQASFKSDSKSMDQIVANGIIPEKAVYIHTLHILSHYVNALLNEEELKPFTKVIKEAEDEYTPDGPPMSAVIPSYFEAWVISDIAIGQDKETLTGILLDLQEILKLQTQTIQILKYIDSSRMGIYEHLGFQNEQIRLRELTTGKIFNTTVSTGYYGLPGECWFVRLMPHLLFPQEQWVNFTTPYVLTSGVAQWQEFFNRAIWRTQKETLSDEQLLKFGMNPYYWLEYVHQAYAGIHQKGSVLFLRGVPDLGHTRPHYSTAYPLRLPEACM